MDVPSHKGECCEMTQVTVSSSMLNKKLLASMVLSKQKSCPVLQDKSIRKITSAKICSSVF